MYRGAANFVQVPAISFIYMTIPSHTRFQHSNGYHAECLRQYGLYL